MLRHVAGRLTGVAIAECDETTVIDECGATRLILTFLSLNTEISRMDTVVGNRRGDSLVDAGADRYGCSYRSGRRSDDWRQDEQKCENDFGTVCARARTRGRREQHGVRAALGLLGIRGVQEEELKRRIGRGILLQPCGFVHRFVRTSEIRHLSFLPRAPLLFQFSIERIEMG